jgi:hypothetical protein
VAARSQPPFGSFLSKPPTIVAVRGRIDGLAERDDQIGPQFGPRDYRGELEPVWIWGVFIVCEPVGGNAGCACRGKPGQRGALRHRTVVALSGCATLFFPGAAVSELSGLGAAILRSGPAVFFTQLRRCAQLQLQWQRFPQLQQRCFPQLWRRIAQLRRRRTQLRWRRWCAKPWRWALRRRAQRWQPQVNCEGRPKTPRRPRLPQPLWSGGRRHCGRLWARDPDRPAVLTSRSARINSYARTIQ